MSQESVGEWMSSYISGRVTGTNELDSLKADPLLVRVSPEALLLCELSQEGDDSLGVIGIDIGKIDLITEDDKPFVGLLRSQNDS